MFSPILSAAAIAAIALPAAAQAPRTPARPAPGAPEAQRDWTQTVSRKPDGAFVLGNPQAPVRLVEYISYTCSHCADFSRESSAVLKGQMVRSGSTSVEFRNAARDRLDLAAAMLARCGGQRGFFDATAAILAAQPQWMDAAIRWESANRDALGRMTPAQAMKGYADGSGLSAIMRRRGMTDAQIGQCLANQRSRDIVLAMTREAFGRIDGTPGFAIDGQITGDAAWAPLEPRLRAAGAR